MYIKKDILEKYQILEDKFDVKKDKELLYKAFLFAYKTSKDGINLDWELIIIHVINTAIIAYGITKELTISITCLLHHSLYLTVEDEKEIENTFGKEVFKILQWIIAITKIKYKEWELTKNPTLFTYFLKVSWNDIRVFLIKICSRLDFITNYNKLNKSEKKRIATETLEIYIPLIRLFWITKYIKNIEDLCYKNIKPEEYKKTEKLLWEKREFLENKIINLREIIEEIAIEKDVPIELHSRIKSIYSLAKKMEIKKCPISWIYDLIALRIITKTKREAYEFLCFIHSIFKSKENRIKDYISSPKPNGYQSIHTTVVDNSWYVFEIQIQTKQMYEFNIFWIASHNLYKGSIKNPKSYPEWMKKINNTKKQSFNGEEIVDLFQNNFVNNIITCITPHQDRVELPKDSTILDFAFKIHSDLAKRLKWAWINWEYIKNLTYILNDSDEVKLDLLEDEIEYPIEYISLVKTKNAKKSIINSYKSKSKVKVISLWKFLLNERIDLLNYKSLDKMPSFIKKEVFKQNDVNWINDIYYEIGVWNISIDKIIKIIWNLKEEQGKYKNTVWLNIKFKNKNHKNITWLFNVFHNFDINVINIDYRWIITNTEINLKDIETLNEVIVEISRLPNIYKVKRIISSKMKFFVAIFIFFSTWIAINPIILFLIEKSINIPEIIYKSLFYVNILLFISMLYLLKYIANSTLPWLIKQNFFWIMMFWLNTIILFTVIIESIYIFQNENSIFLLSLVILMYWLTIFEYLDTKLKNKINYV